MNRNVIATLLALPLALPALAQAENSAVKISGFGTGALTWSDNDRAEFARPNQASGTAKTIRTGVDSNLGLQADYAINDWLSLTAQGLVRKDGDEQYGAELSWAFAKARISDELSVRVGRIGMPTFMISDYRSVGYAHTLLRPPGEVYSQVPLDNIDGADITWQKTIGATTVTSQLAIGSTSKDMSGQFHARGKEIVALNVAAEHGPFTVRAGHARAKITIDDMAALNTLIGAMRATGAGYQLPQVAALAGEIEAIDKLGTFSSVGLTMDWNNVVLQSEFAKRRTKSFINDTTSWYVMGGYRFGNILPYYAHAKLKSDGNVNAAALNGCPAGYPAACNATLQQLAGGMQLLSSTGASQGQQTTDTIGVRWDFASSVALKVQVDRMKPRGNGLFVNGQPGFKGPVTVGAVSLDFVF